MRIWRLHVSNAHGLFSPRGVRRIAQCHATANSASPIWCIGPGPGADDADAFETKFREASSNSASAADLRHRRHC
jgi:hypothetical protein